MSCGNIGLRSRFAMSAFDGRPLFFGAFRVSRRLVSLWSKPGPSSAPFDGRGAMYARGGLLGGLGVFEVSDLRGDDWVMSLGLPDARGGEYRREAGTPSWFRSCRHCFMLRPIASELVVIGGEDRNVALPRGSCIFIKSAGMLFARMKTVRASTLTGLALITSARMKR